MTTSSYQGRHRSAPDGRQAPTGTTAGGRHRRSGRALPRLAGTGVLLPTVATAAVVLTTTGAHLGAATPNPAGSTVAASVAAAGTAGTAQAAGAASAADAAARQQAVATAASSLAVQSRSLTDRAARDAARADAADRAAQAAAAAHRWVAPLAVSYTLTSGFGMRWGSMHPGQDFAVPVGSPVMAMSSGTVLFAGWEGGYGNKLEIKYWDGTISWYAHNSRLQVAQGDTVTPGEVVALSGNTGHSTGPHSHIEIHLGGDDTEKGAVPPIPWLTQHGAMPGHGSAGTSTAGD